MGREGGGMGVEEQMGKKRKGKTRTRYKMPGQSQHSNFIFLPRLHRELLASTE